jgi:hypothetical protein
VDGLLAGDAQGDRESVVVGGVERAAGLGDGSVARQVRGEFFQCGLVRHAPGHLVDRRIGPVLPGDRGLRHHLDRRPVDAGEVRAAAVLDLA